MDLFDFFFFSGPIVLCFPFLVALPMIIFMVIVGWGASMRGKRQIVVTAVSTEKRVIDENTRDIWVCKLETGGEIVYFYNSPNPFAGKFLPGVLEIQGKFEEGALYRLTVAGIKRDSLGMFQNILEAEKLL